MGMKALVLSGGGARGAYEAGVLHYVLTQLPPAIQDKVRFEIYTASSAGAINSCFLAAWAHDLKNQAPNLRALWETVTAKDIYRRGSSGLSRFLYDTVTGVTGNFLRRLSAFSPKADGSRHFRGLFDTAPFREYLKKKVPWPQIGLNLKKGNFWAIALAVTSNRSGRLNFFVQKDKKIKYAGAHRIREVDFGPEHAMASAAIPLLFPQVSVGKDFYSDGSLRQNTPLSPAVHMGAKRLFIITTYSRSEEVPTEIVPLKPAKAPPSAIHAVEVFLHSTFLDRIEYDLRQTERINAVIEASERTFGPGYLQRVNEVFAMEYRQTEFGERSLGKLKLLVLSPSQDIAKIACDCLGAGSSHPVQFSSFEKFLMHLFDIDPIAEPGLLSYLLFDKRFTGALTELGYEDARTRHDELVEFFV